VLQAGSIVNLVTRFRVWHFGRLEFRVCKYSGAETTSTLNQACLDKIILKPAPQQTLNRTIPGQPWWWVGIEGSLAQEYTMQYIIPSDLSCDGVSTFCVLQMSYVTGNSCNPSGYCPTTAPAFCKPPGWFPTCSLIPPNGEVFRNCADIIVKGGTPTASPPPVKAASPPPPVKAASSPPPVTPSGARVTAVPSLPADCTRTQPNASESLRTLTPRTNTPLPAFTSSSPYVRLLY